MTAYVLADINVTDPARYEDYKVLATAAVQKYGGRYIIRGGSVEALEGECSQAPRFAVLEFTDGDAARRWYTSPEYTAARKIRQEASTARLVLIEP